MNGREVAIIGMECVFPGARNLHEYWQNLVDGVDAIRAVPPGRLNGNGNLAGRRGGFLPEDLRFEPLKFGIMPNIVPQGDPDQFLMLDVIDRALRDAGVAEDDPVRQHCDVIIGRGGYITNKMSEIYYRSDLLEHLTDYLANRFPELAEPQGRAGLAEELRAALPASDVDRLSTCIPNLVASRVANRLNLCGAAYTVDAACASSLLSVEQAVQRLRQGQCDLAVASGIFLCQTPTFWYIFTELGAMSPSARIRPFDRRADGLLVGEGAGAVILKRLDDARRDGDQVYAVIQGVGLSSDGRQSHVLASSSAGQIAALRRAYRDAEIDPSTIGYLEAHGTGTLAGDAAELATLAGFWGPRGKFPPSRAFGSVKSMIGHTMPAAGIASLIKTALSLSNRILLPSLHCEQPHEGLAQVAFYLNRETRPWIHPTGRHPRRAGVNAFGFGGINAHLVLEEVPDAANLATGQVRRRPHAPGQRPSELVLFSGTSRQALLDRLEDVENALGQLPSTITLHDLAAALAEQVDITAPHKLALVCTDLKHLERLVRDSRSRLALETPTFDDDSVYYSAEADQPKGRVAGIFPGIGFPGLIGTYPSHLMELCRYFPEVRVEFDRFELRDEHPEDAVPTSLVFQPPSSLAEEEQAALRNRIAAMKVVDPDKLADTEQAPWQRNLAAPGVTLGNWVSWLLLEKLGIPVDMVCGQSQGEIAAMCAAGILRMEEVVPRFWQGLKVSPGYAGRGRLAFIVTNEARLAPYLAEAPDTSVAIHVAPEMLIVGGSNEHLEAMTARLRAEGLIANLLPYPPIHTPRLSHMRDELRQILDLNLPFRSPSIPIYSAITEEPFPEGADAIRELALDNLDRPVRFWQTIHRMYDAGARVFLQVGGGTLASNIRTILPKPDILGPAVDLDHRHPLSQLQHLCAALFTAGIRFRPAYLYAYPPPKPIDWDALGTPQEPPLSVPLRMDWTPLPSSRVLDGGATAGLPSSVFLETAPHTAGQANSGTPTTASMTLPMLGELVDQRPGEAVTLRRTLDLEHDLFLHDHAVVDPQSGKAIENRMAILPMAFILEAVAETGVCLLPELGLIGIERAAALRWIDFHDTSTIGLELSGRLASVDPETGVHRVTVELLANGKLSASATALLAPAYREDIRFELPELSNARPWTLAAQDIYRLRHMFHGPRFQCVSSLALLGDEGLVGEITVPHKNSLFASTEAPTLLLDPIVLDGVVQLVAMWVIAHGAFLMPAKIGKLELYGPSPPPGTAVPVRIAIRAVDLQGRTVRADAEIEDGAGNVWFRLEGIHEWLYQYSPRLQQTQRLPWRHHLAELLSLPELPPESVCALVARADLRHANLEWLARLYLTQEEWLVFEQWPTLHKQVRWLMGRIAAKDAARIYLAGLEGREMLHPARLAIELDEAGKPYAQPLVAGWPAMEISISQTEQFGVALASAVPCGVDIEPRGRDIRSLLDQFAHEDEIALLDAAVAQSGDTTWPARLWCAKEAVSKLLGTGLQGRPSDFQGVDFDDDGRLLIHHGPTQTRYVVHSCLDGSLVLGYAEASEVGPAEADGPLIELASLGERGGREDE